MELKHLRTNHQKNPVGCPTENLTLSWVLEGDKKMDPTASRIEIAEDPSFDKHVYDSGWGKHDNLAYYPGGTWDPRTRYYWRVRVKGKENGEAVSDMAWFETAREKEPWSAKWICAPFPEHPVFSRRFRAKEGMTGRVYLCGLGLYELWCNGQKVGDEVLLPGYHSYDYRIMYQTLELDPYLKNGENEVKVFLAPGWYMGRFGFGGGASNIYGDTMTLLAEIHVGEQMIGTDASWQCAKSPVTESGIYDGEIWDASLEDPMEWKASEILPEEQQESLNRRLTARTNVPIRPVAVIEPVETIHTPSGDTVLDFGQNMAGWFTFFCDEPCGSEVKVEAAEILQDGEFYTENLREAKARLIYRSAGRKAQVRPHFTFYGFRYLRVTGCSDLERAEFRAIVLTSQLRRTGWLETGDEMLNRLIENSRWGQISNFIDVPTDCPQRDERMGWTGDTQIYSGTACYNYDSSAFYAKFMEDVNLEQKDLSGSVPFVVPDPKIPTMGNGEERAHGSCAWADVATIVPWNVYMHYGDKKLLEKEYPGMKGWVEYMRTQETPEHLWLSGFHFADWLALDNPEPGPLGKTDAYYCASAYYYYSTVLTAKAAAELGYQEEAADYERLAEAVKSSFISKYFDENGKCTEDTQTAYVVALMFGLYREEQRERLAAALHRKLEEKNMHLDTGFIGTGYLCRVLADNGLQEDAVTLLLQKDLPGWLYPITMGATTIWERWNSVMPDGHMNPDGMNSLNHYAYGSVCEWMYRDLAGLSPVEPGFKKVRFAPKPDGRLSYVKGEYHSAMGIYVFGWNQTEEGFRYLLTVPLHCTAIVELPGKPPFEVTEGTYQFME